MTKTNTRNNDRAGISVFVASWRKSFLYLAKKHIYLRKDSSSPKILLEWKLWLLFQKKIKNWEIKWFILSLMADGEAGTSYPLSRPRDQASPADLHGKTPMSSKQDCPHHRVGPTVSVLVASLALLSAASYTSILSLPACLSSLLLNDSHLPESSSQNPQWTTLRTPHVWW